MKKKRITIIEGHELWLPECEKVLATNDPLPCTSLAERESKLYSAAQVQDAEL